MNPEAAPKPDKGRDVERKDDRLRDGRELPLQPRHDALHVERIALALFPRLQAREEGAVVRLVRVGDRPVAADGLERLDPLGLGQDLFHLLEHHARPLQRGPGRKLDGDAEDPLVLVRDEPGRDHAGKEAGPHHHHGDDPDRQDSPAARGCAMRSRSPWW